MIRLIPLVSFLILLQINTMAQVTIKMSNERMDKILHRNSKVIEGQLGYWRVTYNNQELYIITDESHNRMRIMTPIAEINIEEETGEKKSSLSKKELAENQKAKLELMNILLEANYDRALDAKYAIQKGILFAVFTHPLFELEDIQFLDAMKQVTRLVETYGTTFMSSDLTFQPGE